MKLPAGFSLSGINCGIRQTKLDLGLIHCENESYAVGFFTSNVNTCYSIQVSRKHINYPVKAIIVNSGNANCFSHKTGTADTEKICIALAKQLKVKKENILIASTGIIGKKLPEEKIIAAIPALLKKLGNNIDQFSQSILTTDTFPKIAQETINIPQKQASILGFTKGAGMISPNMATMLGFVLTDVLIPVTQFKKICRQAIEKSFNSITVDGCMSTNDTVFFVSSGKVLLKTSAEIKMFSEKIEKLCLDLAKMIVKDGEGATKFIEIQVTGAKSINQAKTAGLSAANSNLFKCAIYGQDPNWGRIIAAMGAEQIAVNTSAKITATPLDKSEVKITINLNQGKHNWTVYTCDLTPEYVKINADYS
jgi:glutamate N-acetyltransferase/amino-acid N-acetyltransferase